MNIAPKQQYELSTDINIITAEINAYQRVAGEAIFEIGRRLKHVKENDLAHGEFGKWLESVDIDRTLATRLMKIADEFDGKYATSHKLGVEALYQIATLPPEQREQPHTIPSTGETKTPDEMTVRELREVKRALREAEEAKAAALQRAKQAEAQRDTAARSEEILRRQLEAAEEREPEVEIRIEYVEDERTMERLSQYEERFGAIENYSGGETSTNLASVTTAVMVFSKEVRELIKRNAFLIKYRESVDMLDPITRREYNEAVTALKEFAEDFQRTSGDVNIIDAVYSEVQQ